jgi:hypothetical protein
MGSVTRKGRARIVDEEQRQRFERAGKKWPGPLCEVEAESTAIAAGRRLQVPSGPRVGAFTRECTCTAELAQTRTGIHVRG